MTKLPATLKLRPKDPKFKASIHNLLRPCLKVTVIEPAENTAQRCSTCLTRKASGLTATTTKDANSLVLYEFQRGFQVFKV